jgi:hypothetical protein
VRTKSAFFASLLLVGLATAAAAAPVTTHPRLLVRGVDLPRLQAWAVPSNPVFQDGLLPLAIQAKADMDTLFVPPYTGWDGGTAAYETYPSEMYAMLFAFMSLITTDPPTRADYIARARTLLMYVMDQAVLGPLDGQPFRGTAFATSDRSRWYGEGFALTVDWIYADLSTADKTTIRQVFLRWADENVNATTTSFNHPEPVGVFDDPQLTANPQAVRFSTNNYYAAHMRNLGLMAMALDDAADPGSVLRAYLHNATGGFLYVLDYLLHTDSRGGMAPEGFEYSPQSIGYLVQFLLALHTAGRDDPAAWGGPLEPQVVLTNNPFWDAVLPAYLSAVSPAPTAHPYLGEVYQPAWYGAAQNYWAPDFIGAFGALGVYDYLTGNMARYAALRWFETYIPPGLAAGLLERVRDENYFFHGVLYFLLLDPAASAIDPRPALPLTFFSAGIGRLLARTSWEPGATWFTYALSWNSIDHQNADGNQFEFYRRGEWLTKQRTGYDLDYGASDNHNTLSLENSPPEHNDPTDYRHMLYVRGSQWLYRPAGDPQIVARSTGPGFVYALGDATDLYNSTYENSTDILHASRSIVWLKPDHIVVYDRAESQTAGRFKRFWLNLPAQAVVAGNQSSMTTPTGLQQLFVTTLLPAGAAISSPPEPIEPSGTPANQETMLYRLLVEPPGGPASVRFLHVLQGADAGVGADAITLVESTGGTPFVGAVVRNTVTLFPVDLGPPFTGMTYSVPDGVTVHRITGLTPGGLYDLTVGDPAGGQVQLTVSPGTTIRADDGGVLVQGNPFDLSLVIRGTDNGIYHNRFAGTGWNGWTALPGATASIPALAASGGGVLDLVVRGIDDGIYHNHFDGTAWSGWAGLPGATADIPALAASGGGVLDLVVRGIDNGVYHNHHDGVAWSGWVALPGATASIPALAASGGGVLDLVVRGIDDGVYHNHYDGTAWGGWAALPGATADIPALAASGGGVLDLVVRGIDNGVYHNHYAGAAWSGWVALPGATASIPALAASGGGVLDLVVRGIDDGIYHNHFDGAGWGGWIPLPGATADIPAVAASGGGVLDLVVRGIDNGVYHNHYDGTAWSGWTPVGGSTASRPALVAE